MAETTPKSIYGFAFMRRANQRPKITREHADPGPDGEVFDEVDEGCRRPPVR